MLSRHNWIKMINKRMIEIAKIEVKSHFIVDTIILFLSSGVDVCDGVGEEDEEVVVVVMSVG